MTLTSILDEPGVELHNGVSEDWCVTLAETKDHLNWELIGLAAEKADKQTAKVLAEKARMLFDSMYPEVSDFITTPVWAAGEVLNYGNFNTYVTSLQERLRQPEHTFTGQQPPPGGVAGAQHNESGLKFEAPDIQQAERRTDQPHPPRPLLSHPPRLRRRPRCPKPTRRLRCSPNPQTNRHRRCASHRRRRSPTRRSAAARCSGCRSRWCSRT